MGGYYGTLEFKGGMAKEIGGSRACGVLLSPGMPLIVYNTMESLMKWAKKTERTMRSRMEAVFRGKGYRGPARAVMFGNRMDMLERLLESDGGLNTTANKIVSFYGVTDRHNDSFLCDNIQFFAYRKTCTPSCYRTT